MFGHGRSKSRRWRQGREGTAALLVTGVGLATVTWLLLVLSPSHGCWHKLRDWQGSPSAFPWLPLDADPEDRTVSSPPLRYVRPPASGRNSSGDLSLQDIVFGIAGSARLWPRRREFVRLWWRPGHMRGFVWLEEEPAEEGYHGTDLLLPPIRISEDISRFRYTNPTGHPSGLRISRIVLETFRLGLPGVKWYVLGDDDTIFNAENLVRVLGKYDPAEMYYIGGPSESHSANTYFSHSMAFGGGGIAISYPLARALAEMQDECLERYPELFGSDDRLHACITELGVPLTRELGFHQWDVRGSAFGLLAAHPVAPFISMHHVEAIDPVFPEHDSLGGLRLLTKAMKTEPSSFLQRSICYDHKRRLTFSVSLGYVVQVFPKIVLPRVLERPELTFKAWNKKETASEFDFDTRRSYRSACRKPFLFFLQDVHIGEGSIVVGTYKRDEATDSSKRRAFCFSWALPPHEVQEIQVISKPLTQHWHLIPRRQCCKLTETQNKVLRVKVGSCEQGNSSFI